MVFTEYIINETSHILMNKPKYWIALEQAQGIGPAHMKEIYEALSGAGLSVEDLFSLEKDEITREFPFGERLAASIVQSQELLHSIEGDYLDLLDAGMSVIPFFSELYPNRFFDTLGNSFPPLLYVYGNPGLLSKKGIAVLGDKFVSQKGEEIAYTAARELSAHGILTVSGFASGVDLIAHRSALSHNGTTAAFLPYGISRLRMPEILQGVFNPDRICVVSTFYPDTGPSKYNAFIRNKFACALSYGVFIVESPLEGGVFEAAKSAHNLGIPLFTTKYAEFPKSAEGNSRILNELEGIPVTRKSDGDMLVPNMDRLIACAKF